MSYVSRAGAKLEFALKEFNIDVNDKICADLGCSTGGFTDCLLQHGAAKIYSVDTGYGVLDYRLRQNPKVIVMERINAMHVVLPELVDLVTVDVSWTPQHLILPHAFSLLKSEGKLISLLKPHYEAHKAHIDPGELDAVVENILNGLSKYNLAPERILRSPVVGEKGKNVEFVMLYSKHAD